MAHPGRPRKCDPRVDSLRSDINSENYDIAKATLAEFGIDSTDGDGRTALINAVIEKKPEFIQWLLGQGANISAQDKIGYSALHFAASMILVDIAKYLLEKKANPNLPDMHGNTPLWTAIFSAKLLTTDQGVVKLLLKFGADPEIINHHGKTPGFMYKTFHNVDISSVAIS